MRHDTEIAAGRELDALIAVEVMDWERRQESWYGEEGVEGTTFISPDERVTLQVLGWWDDCDYDDLGDDLPAYSTDLAAAWQVVEKLDLLATAETAPLDICRAALRAVPARP